MTRSLGAALTGAALAVLLFPAVCSGAGQPEPRRLLVFPVQSHWLSQPLADQMTAALADRLAEQGIAAVVYDQDAPMFRERPFPLGEGAASAAVTSPADWYALCAGAHASLTVNLQESERELAAEARLEGAVSKRAASFETKAALAGSKQRAVRELARQVASGLTPELWAEAGADAEGRRRAAARRFVEGQEAKARGNEAEASVHFQAALAGDPERAEYFAAAAESELAASGDYQRALILLRRASELAPGDVELLLRRGEVALLAGRAEEAEGAFRLAQGAAPGDLRPLEGLARAARAQGQFERAVGYYQELIGRLPGLAEEPPATARLLAGQASDLVRLTTVGPEELPREIGLLFLSAGRAAEGVEQLLRYHEGAERPRYAENQYLAASSGLDAEAEAIFQEARAALAARDLEEAGEEDAEHRLEALHQRSDNLATLGEKMEPPAGWEPAHRYRVLAWNLLNQSNFEALLYARTRDDDRLRRYEFWRKAYREAISEARRLQPGAAEGPEE